tara:strand:+ start:8081 stop:8461 length:381 start_codon:yes stop_codon:yes gene_type:complete
MVLDTSIADSKIKIRDELKKLEKDKSFKRTELPADKVENNSSKNPFLDVSVRELVDDFVLTWHKILFELLDVKKYEDLKYGEWWDTVIEIFNILKEVFWVDDRLFHIGVGFVILSFFVFFICVTHK